MNSDLVTIAERVARYVTATTTYTPTVAEILQDVQAMDDYSPLPYAKLLALDDKELATNIALMGVVGMLFYGIKLGGKVQ